MPKPISMKTVGGVKERKNKKDAINEGMQPAADAELDDRQERFCQEYVTHFNMSEAAISAGYAKASARQQASVLMTRPNISNRVAQLLKEKKERSQVNADEVLREIMRVGYSDIRDLYNDDGAIKHPSDWPEGISRAVAAIEVQEIFVGDGDDRKLIGYTKRIRLWPKDKALDMLSRNLGLLTDKVEHSGVVTLEALVAGPPAIALPAPQTLEEDES